MTDLPRGNLKKKLFFPTFQGLNSISELSDSESPDCDNWIPYNSELQKHGPRLASASLLTTPYAGAVRLIKKWLGKDGRSNELHLVTNGTGYDVVYPNSTTGTLATQSLSLASTVGIQAVGGGVSLAFGATYYSADHDLGVNQWYSSPAPTDLAGVTIGLTDYIDLSEYNHIDRPALTIILGCNPAPANVTFGYRIGNHGGVDVTLGTWDAVADGNPKTYTFPATTGLASTIGYYGEFFVWGHVNGAANWQFDPVHPAITLSAGGNIVFKA